jgi:phospholipid/cholesterol/gamma-HCH transport system ATP-binding protein
MVRAEGVVKHLGGRDVLAGLTLEARERETLVLLGRSGTGKSVFLKHVIGLMQPDAGRLEVMGEDVTRATPKAWNRLRRDVAMVFQNAALFDSMTVGENVALGLEHHRRGTKQEIARRVEACLERVGLPGISGTRPAALSGGMRKRVGIARAIALEPKLLLYDEPTSGLDPITSDVINRLIRRLQQSLGMTSLVVTHDLASAYFVGDRIALLWEGRVRALGTPAEIQASSDPVVRQFVEGRSEEPAPRGG